MPDATDAERPARPRHDVVRAQPGRLVGEDDPERESVTIKPALGSRRSARRARGRSRTPAARRWPPPPNARAIADTSTSSSVARSDTLRRRGGRRAISRISTATFVPGDRAQLVDDPLGSGCRRRRSPRSPRRGSIATVSAAVVEARDARERAREQLELLERHALVDLAVDRGDVDAGLDQLRRHPVRAGRRVLIGEAPGVGHEADVQRLRDLRRQLDAEPGREVPDELSGAGGVLDDVVDGAEARVVVVVVDVQERLDVAQRRERDAVEVAAVEEDRGAAGRGRRAPPCRGRRARRRGTPAAAGTPRARSRSPSPCRARAAPPASRPASRARRRRGARG